MSLEIQYQCSLDDYREAFRAHQNRSVGHRILAGAAFGIVYICVFAVMVNCGFSEGKAFLSVGIFWLSLWALARLLVPVWIKRDFRNHPNFSRVNTLKIDEVGLESQNEISRWQRGWSVYTRFRETENLFILYTGKRSFEVIPKRAFSEPAVCQFRALIQEKVPSL